MSEWQPIETAPKDRSILLCVAGYEPVCGRWYPMRERWWFAMQGCWSPFDWEGHFESDKDAEEFYFGSRYEPTHWMPLPAPPSAVTVGK